MGLDIQIGQGAPLENGDSRSFLFRDTPHEQDRHSVSRSIHVLQFHMLNVFKGSKLARPPSIAQLLGRMRGNKVSADITPSKQRRLFVPFLQGAVLAFFIPKCCECGHKCGQRLFSGNTLRPKALIVRPPPLSVRISRPSDAIITFLARARYTVILGIKVRQATVLPTTRHSYLPPTKATPRPFSLCRRKHLLEPDPHLLWPQER